jgi:hypothetical protein
MILVKLAGFGEGSYKKTFQIRRNDDEMGAYL